jgi:hypothetical protein
LVADLTYVWRKPQWFAATTTSTRSNPMADLAVGLGTLGLLYVVARVGGESLVRFHPPDVIPAVSLDPRRNHHVCSPYSTEAAALTVWMRTGETLWSKLLFP